MNEAQIALNNYFQSTTGASSPADVNLALLKLAADGIGAVAYTGRRPLTAAIAYIESIVGDGRVVKMMKSSNSDIINAEATR